MRLALQPRNFRLGMSMLICCYFLNQTISIAQQSFSMSTDNGCGSTAVSFTNLNPSNGCLPNPPLTTGWKYNWNFGNGSTSTQENPTPVTYSAPGEYVITYQATADTVGFFLTQIDISAVGCNDPFTGPAPEIYIVLFDGNGTEILNTESSAISSDPPLTFTMNIQLTNPPYQLKVWDDDPLDADDNCVDDSENQPGTGTFIMLPANNSSGFGQTQNTQTNGMLTFTAHFNKPTTSFSGTDTVTIYENPASPILSISQATYCVGSSIPDIIAVPQAGNIVNWYGDSALTVLLHTGSSFPVTDTLAGTYNYYATQTTPSGNCRSNAAKATLTIGLLPPPTVSSGATDYCANEQIPPIIAAGGTGISWYSDSTLIQVVHHGDTLQLNNPAPGTHIFYVTQNDTAANCSSDYTEVEVNIHNPATADITVAQISCPGNSDGSISITNITGQTPYSFYWDNGDTSSSRTNLGAGEYIAYVLDGNYCITVFSEQLIAPESIRFNPSVVIPLCFGSSNAEIHLNLAGGTAPYTCIWNNGSLGQDLTGVASGDYAASVTDSRGCTADTTINVTAPPALVASDSLIPAECTGYNDGAIYLNIDGGTPPYALSWNDGSSMEDRINLYAGAYLATITDSNACQLTLSLSLPALREHCLDIATVFTPNGDNINDTWIIRHLDLYPGAKVKVFDRSGALMFESSVPYISWDGKRNGTLIPSDSYYFVIELNEDGQQPFTGTVTIIN
jgi:gliding motility-associated-like protein